MSFSSLETTFSPLEIVFPKIPESTVLPANIEALNETLKTLVASQQSACEQAAQLAYQRAVQAIRLDAHGDIIRMLEQAVLARQRMFGASSEQLSAQSRLFDEAEVLAQSSTEVQDTALIPAEAAPAESAANTNRPSVKPARGKRAPLPAQLERVDVVHDVPESDRTCPCGTAMVEIGQDISEQLDIVPMQVRVLRHIRKRYGCPDGVRAPITAPLPPQPLPKSHASADFLAMLLAVKFVDGLPLARFEHVLDRHGVPVPRQTLARWVIGCAGVLQPLHNLMRDILLDGSLIYMDETVVQVLKGEDRSPTSNSYMWVQTGGPPDKPVVLYDYDQSRSAKVPVRLLEGFKGFLMTDGYDGYNEIERTEGVERLACWAHVRRRFVEAVRVQPKGKRGKADEAVALIGKLYGIEREHKESSIEERLSARQSRSVPVLQELQAWLHKTAALGHAQECVGYGLGLHGQFVESTCRVHAARGFADRQQPL